MSILYGHLKWSYNIGHIDISHIIWIMTDEHKQELQRKLEEVKELNRQAQESQNVMKQAPDPSSRIPGSNPKESGKIN